MEPDHTSVAGTTPPIDATPRRSRSATTHSLLQATIDAIDMGGEAAVRVQEIADAAGVQIPILYRQFGSRDGLIQAAQIERLSRALAREMDELAAAMETIASPKQFRALIDAILASLDSPERRSARWKRVNVVGSTYGRPDLAAAVSLLQTTAVHGIAHALRRPQESGWLRDGLDLEAFAAWFAGQTMGRVLIELGTSDVDESAWNSISADAVRHILLG
jgi:AcrR family transcriptional regulator